MLNYLQKRRMFMSSNTKQYRVVSLVYFGERLSAKGEKVLAHQLVSLQSRLSPENVNVSVIQADESDIALSTLVKAQPMSIENPTDDIVQSAKLIGLMFEKEISNTVALTIAMNAKVVGTATNASDENIALIRALKEACKPDFIEKLGTNYASQYHIDKYVVNTIKQVLDFNGISHEQIIQRFSREKTAKLCQ